MYRPVRLQGGITMVMQNLNSCNGKREMSQEHWVHPRGRQAEGHTRPPGQPSAVTRTEESCPQSPKPAVQVRTTSGKEWSVLASNHLWSQ